jgi:hypothetical protein
VGGGEPVEQMNADGEGQLLAGDAVDQRLEHGRKTRWLESAHALGQRSDQGVCHGHGRERRQVDAQPQQPVHCVACQVFVARIERAAAEHDREARSHRAAVLGHRQRDRPAIDLHDAAVRA